MDYTVYINGTEEISVTVHGQSSGILVIARLGGVFTTVILYEFLFFNDCVSTNELSSLFSTGINCSYVCFGGGAVPCSANSYNYDSNCFQCTDCTDRSCSSAVTTPNTCADPGDCTPFHFSDFSCKTCYNDAVSSLEATYCHCGVGFYNLATTPELQCYST